MKEIYIAIWEDHHADTTAHPFSDPQKAIDWARAKAKESCNYLGDYAEHDYGEDEGWIFYADYSSESDRVYVVIAEMDAE